MEGEGDACFRQNYFQSLIFSYKYHSLSHSVPKGAMVSVCVCPSNLHPWSIVCDIKSKSCLLLHHHHICWVALVSNS